MTNTLAYYGTELIYSRKIFMIQAPGQEGKRIEE